MYEYCTIQERDGLFSTILPPFEDGRWRDVLPPSGYVWIEGVHVELADRLESIVSELLLSKPATDLKCSVYRLELDVSLPVVEFLQHTRTTFRYGVNLIHSQKHLPPGFRLEKVAKSLWPNVMRQNEISLALHRPFAGEPALITAPERATIAELAAKFRT